MKEYFRYTLSNIFSMLGLSCYILMDTFFISLALGAKGLASLNLVLPGFNLITATGLMLGIGGATRYILYEKEDASLPSGSAFPMAIQSGLIFSCVLACIGGFGAQWIAGVLGAKGALLAMSTDYIRTVLLFTPAFVCNDILNIYMKNDGNPTLAMTAMIAGSLVNIVLDYLFLFPMHMGMFGAALATGFSPIVGLLISSLHFLQKKNHFHYCPSSFSVPVLKSIFSLGFPKFVSEISAGIIIVVFNQILLDLAGHTAVAAYGIVANLSLVLIAVFSGLAEGVQPLYSRAKEQHNPQRLKQLWKYTLLFMSGIVAMGVLVIFLKTADIVSVFNAAEDPALQHMAQRGLKIYFSGLWFVAFNIQLGMFLVSVDLPRAGRIIALLKGILLIIPMVFFFSSLWQTDGVWLATPCTEALVALVGVQLYRQKKKQIYE